MCVWRFGQIYNSAGDDDDDDNADDNNDDDDDYYVNGDDDNESEDRMLSSTISKFKKSINLWTTSKPVLNLPSECKLGQSLKKFY